MAKNKIPKKRAFIVHGWGGYPDEGWFPWLRKELKTRGFHAESVEMPDTNNPALLGWYEALAKAVKDPDNHTYLIGHSLGVMTILRYLEALPEGSEIGGAVLVSGFYENLWPPEIPTFFGNHLDFDLIKEKTRNFTIIHALNDAVVPFSEAEKLQHKLKAKLIALPEGGHLNNGYGVKELPGALAAILEMVSLAEGKGV